MKKKNVQLKSKELLSIERKIKKQLKFVRDNYLDSNNKNRKSFYAGAYTSLSLLLDSINNK